MFAVALQLINVHYLQWLGSLLKSFVPDLWLWLWEQLEIILFECSVSNALWTWWRIFQHLEGFSHPKIFCSMSSMALFLRYHFRLLNAQEEESTVSTQNVAYVKNILLFSLSNNWCKINSKMPNASTARIMAFYTKCKILPGTVGVYIDLTALETLLIWALHMMPTK